MLNFKHRRLYPREIIPVPIEQEAGWAPELVWTFQWTEHSSATTGTLIPDRPARCVVGIPTPHPPHTIYKYIILLRHLEHITLASINHKTTKIHFRLVTFVFTKLDSIFRLLHYDTNKLTAVTNLSSCLNKVAQAEHCMRRRGNGT
jgi:hypothetical protein